jgi:hypothetical protein
MRKTRSFGKLMKTNHKTDPITMPRASMRFLKRRTALTLILYLVYAGSIVMIGIKMGLFGQWADSSARHLEDSPLQSPETRVRPLLPQGILSFDADLKQIALREGVGHAQFVFNFTNTSRTVVVLERVSTSCGCTTAQLPQMPWSIAPRSKGRIPVTLDVLGLVGKVFRTLTVTTDQGVKVLTVEAEIIPVPAKQEQGTNTATIHSR